MLLAYGFLRVSEGNPLAIVPWPLYIPLLLRIKMTIGRRYRAAVSTSAKEKPKEESPRTAMTGVATPYTTYTNHYGSEEVRGKREMKETEKCEYIGWIDGGGSMKGQNDAKWVLMIDID